MNLTTIVLAAGQSSRMGEPKFFLPLSGSTLLRLAVTAALEVSKTAPVIIVTGAYDAAIREHLAPDDRISIVHNPGWSAGMASSLAAGVRAATIHAPGHYLITLADQPTMTAANLARLTAASLRWPDRIIATAYPERAGVPAIFPATFTDELTGQQGAFGARRLIKREGGRVRTITFNFTPVDIDTPEDYQRFKDHPPQ